MCRVVAPCRGKLNRGKWKMSQWVTEFIAPAPRIAVDHAGIGPLVVFLHGVGGNRTLWHDQLIAFAPYFHAVAWDARGYGLSDDCDGPLKFGDFADDVLRVVDHFEVKKAHVVGMSMGGRIAMNFCLRYPDRVATLTLADTSEGFEHVSPEKRAEFIRLRKEPLLQGKELKDIAPSVARSLMRKSAPDIVYQRLHDSMAALHKDSYLKTIEAIVNAPAMTLEQIRVPTHVVVGDQDDLTPPELSRRIAARISGSRLSIIPEAAHISNVEQPDVFNQIVLEFLFEHRLAAA
jgi:3-oxoadipate enol-lactonase